MKANFRVFSIPSKGRKTNKKQFYKEIEAFLCYYIVKRRFVGLLCSAICSTVCGLFNLKPSFGFIFGGNGLFKFSAPNEELKRGISKQEKQTGKTGTNYSFKFKIIPTNEFCNSHLNRPFTDFYKLSPYH